jgi:hypothetical protein
MPAQAVLIEFFIWLFGQQHFRQATTMVAIFPFRMDFSSMGAIKYKCFLMISPSTWKEK